MTSKKQKLKVSVRDVTALEVTKFNNNCVMMGMYFFMHICLDFSLFITFILSKVMLALLN